ncbi:hypothetical protein BC629DRAFT_1479316, partial [Irpex lacteus]
MIRECITAHPEDARSGVSRPQSRSLLRRSMTFKSATLKLPSSARPSVLARIRTSSLSPRVNISFFARISY